MAQNPIVTFEMENGGIIKAELYPELAPNTVNNFISLIQKGYYDGLIFHRVTAMLMLWKWFEEHFEVYLECIMVVAHPTLKRER